MPVNPEQVEVVQAEELLAFMQDAPTVDWQEWLSALNLTPGNALPHLISALVALWNTRTPTLSGDDVGQVAMEEERAAIVNWLMLHQFGDDDLDDASITLAGFIEHGEHLALKTSGRPTDA